MNAYEYGYCVAMAKLGSVEALELLKQAGEGRSVNTAAAESAGFKGKVPDAQATPEARTNSRNLKNTGGNAPKASQIPGAKYFGRMPGWGKALAIGGAGLAAGAGIGHALTSKDR